MSVRWGSDEVADLLWKRLLRVMRRVNATAVHLHACDVRLLEEEYGLPKAAEIMRETADFMAKTVRERGNLDETSR